MMTFTTAEDLRGLLVPSRVHAAFAVDLDRLDVVLQALDGLNWVVKTAHYVEGFMVLIVRRNFV